MQNIRWGILGAGRIAGVFAQGLRAAQGAQLAAVASRSEEKAAEFARAYGIPRAYGSYEALLADRDIDVVYIATPHTGHRENALAAIRAGKAVLCEKPLAPNAAQAREIVEAAGKAGVFLMEAAWTRLLPAVRQALRLAREGRIGELRQLDAAFCTRSTFDARSRLFDPALAGGALLDVGVYPLHLASMFLGPRPVRAVGGAFLGQTGVDEQGEALLTYENGAIASLRFAVRTDAGDDAVIYGTEGSLRLPHFWHAQRAELWKGGSIAETFEGPFRKNGYEFEADEVDACLREGRLESEFVPLSETLAVLEIADGLRAAWGERYPFE